MKNKPNVFFKIIRFVGSKAKSYKLPYYKNGHYIRYITRDEACCKHDLNNQQLQELKDKYQNPKYYQQELKKLSEKKDNSGIWNRVGQLTEEDKSKLETKIKNLDSNQLFWDSVISFDQEFANKHELFTPKKIKQLVNQTINKFFNDNNFNSKNMEWFFTFHTNTDNPHIHLGFFEKEPKIYNRKTKSFEYRRKGAIPNLNCKTAALKIENHLEKYIDYSEIYKERSKVMKDFKLAWTDVKQIYTDLKSFGNPLHAKLQELVKLLNYKKGKINYQKPYYYQQSIDIKTKLNEFSELLINEDNHLKENFINYNNVLSKYQDILTEKAKPYETKIKDNNNETSKIILPWQNFAEEQLYGKDGFYSRVGNEILKTIKSLPNFKISKPFLPRTRVNTQINSYFKPNLINRLIRRINEQFYYAHQQADHLFKQIQTIKFSELLNKLE